MSIEKSVDIEKAVDAEKTTVQHREKCIAQVGATPIEICVKPKEKCCKDIVTNIEESIKIYMKDVKVTILKGKVKCGSGYGNKGVEGAIVVATSGHGKYKNTYVGITNSYGYYTICVPAEEKTYSIEAYCCNSCVGEYGGICEDASCHCKCK